MKKLIAILVLAVLASCHLYAEEFNLRILNGAEDDKALAGKTLELKFNDNNGSVFMSMFVENRCVELVSSLNPAICFNDLNYTRFEKTFNIYGELVERYNFFDYSILDKRASKSIVGFFKNRSGEYVLGVIKETFQGREPLFSTYLAAKIDDYATISNLFKKYYRKLAVEPYDIIKTEHGYEMTSYYKGIFGYNRIPGFEHNYGSYSFFLEVKDTNGIEEVSSLAKYLKENFEDGEASGTIVLILDNDEKPVQLDHHNMQAVDDNTILFNLTMNEMDFFKATCSNIIALKTSGNYYILLGHHFESSVILRYMMLLTVFPIKD